MNDKLHLSTNDHGQYMQADFSVYMNVEMFQKATKSSMEKNIE